MTNKLEHLTQKFSDILYDYDIVRRVLNVKELGIPMIFKKDAMCPGKVHLRVFVAETTLRNKLPFLSRLTWKEFYSRYILELQKFTLSNFTLKTYRYHKFDQENCVA